MKKNILLGLLVLGACITAEAQLIDSYGLKGGLVLAEQDVAFTPLDTELPTDILPGMGAAIFVEMFQRSKLSLQLEAAYRSKGHRTTAQSLTVDHLNNDSIIINHGPEVTAKFKYLQFSPMVRIRTELGPTTVYTLVGPAVNFLLDYNSTSPWPLQDQNNMLLGLNGSLGVEYALPKISLFAELAYEVDLMPVYNTQPLWISNSAVIISIGIRK
jgi:hypothetical protein